MSLPESFGRFKVERELGKGAMGRVYLAHDPAIGRKVAIKNIHLPDGLARDEAEEARARFQREVQAAGRLSHPNIVTIYDIGEDPVGGTFIAMEYVQGLPLDEHTRPGHLLDPRTVASIICQAADALAYAHRQKVIHRDIKPANLMLVGERTVKIADFGLAKSADASLTHDGTLLGTPYYMSPEQIRGGEVDGRSDLFGLAVVLYELLTGKRPFRGDSVSAVIYRIIHEPPVAPDLTRMAGGERVKAFLGRALAKNPDERFQAGDDFARALREAVSPREETTPPPEPNPVAPRKKPDLPPLEKAGASLDDAPPPPSPRPETSKRRATGRGRPGSRRRSVLVTPLLVILAVGLAAAFVYRDVLFEQLSPMLGLPAETGQPPEQEPTAELPGEGAPPVPEAPAEPEGRPATGPGTDRPSGTASEGEASGGVAEDGEGEVPDTQPPPEQPAPVIINLASEPPGASFEVGGRSLSTDRITVPDLEEVVTVRASKGCLEGTASIRAADAGETITVPLQAVPAAVRVTAEPSARVQVDGAASGTTPVDLSLDPCKAHVVVLTRDGYKKWTRNLKLADGKLEAPEALAATLTPLPKGTLSIPEAPYPVEVEIDGGRKLQTGKSVSLVEATYRVSFKNSTLMLNRTSRVTIRGNKTASPDIDFPPVARLTLRAQPSNASFEIISGSMTRDLGAPPVFNEEVVAGNYKVRCTFRHNGEVQERTVKLTGGDNPPLVFVAERR